MLVAVYGTLKQWHTNNPGHLDGFEPQDARFVDIPFRMYEGAEYPMIVPSADIHPIFVEVFEVDEDTLENLDHLEAPYNYHRQSVYLAELDREVAIYVYDEPEPPPEFNLVESGKWPR